MRTIPSILILTIIGMAGAPALARGSGHANHDAARPTHYPDGSYRYTYGSEMPVILVGAGDSCDIQLEAGESIRRAFLVVKPTQAGLLTTLTVFTDRRSYHIRLLSKSMTQEEYVGFLYPAERAAATREAEDRASANAAAAIEATYSCKELDTKYVAAGANEFRDAQVCNDGKHTYVNAANWTGDLPMPYAYDNGPDEITNYSFDPKHRQFIIDGVPRKLALIRGGDRTTFERKAQ